LPERMLMIITGKMIDLFIIPFIIYQKKSGSELLHLPDKNKFYN